MKLAKFSTPATILICLTVVSCEERSSNDDDWNLTKFFTSCVWQSSEESTCDFLSSCIAENVLQFAKTANDQCLKSETKLRCDVAPAAFVTLEKLRQLLMDEENSDKNREAAINVVRRLCDDPLLDQAEEENVKLAAAFNKLFSSAGKYMRRDVGINKEISDAEFDRNLRALFALVVSFGLPGLFSVCEPSHLKTTLFLQIISLIAVSFYQFARKGLLWTSLSVACCVLVLIVQFGLLYLFRSKYREEKPILLRE